MPETDLDLLQRAAKAAGEIATRYTGTRAEKWEKPDGAGPVTEADLAVNVMLEDLLQNARPGYGWLSEESEEDPHRHARDRVFIIDPIDGTRSFAEGSKTWAHALAVADKGKVTAGVIYLPQRNLLFAASRGQGATCNGKPIAASRTDVLTQADILAARPNMMPEHWRDGAVPGFQRSYRPSLAYRLAKVADGRFDGMLTLRPSWEWDIAAGDLILREAGGSITDRHGAMLRFNNAHPQVDGVIAANAQIHDLLFQALAPGGPGIAP